MQAAVIKQAMHFTEDLTSMLAGLMPGTSDGNSSNTKTSRRAAGPLQPLAGAGRAVPVGV